MTTLDKIPYKKEILFKDDLEFQGCKQNLFLSKYFCDTDINDRYYLRTSIVDENGNLYKIGYLYFYLNKELSQSKLIGVGIDSNYRNYGIASLLISSWIQLCIDEGLYNLETNAKQRKPFLLYLIKKFYFELENIEMYETSKKTIYICRKQENDNKYLIFKNKGEEDRFKNSNIMGTDNYLIVDRTEKDIEIIDSVILSTPYFIKDNEKGYQKALQIYNKHKK